MILVNPIFFGETSFKQNHFRKPKHRPSFDLLPELGSVIQTQTVCKMVDSARR